MAEIQFFEEAFGGENAGRRPLRTLHLDHDTICVGDLIRFRVETKHAELEPEAAEPVEGSPEWLKAHAEREASGRWSNPGKAIAGPGLEEAIEDARRGLLANAYFLFVNGAQLRDLDEKVALKDVNEAIFLELIPLRGG
jgi:hypothetical protein